MSTLPIFHDPVLGGPIRFRISDDYSHAESFEASTLDEFSIGLLDAIHGFHEWHFTTNSTLIRGLPRDRADQLLSRERYTLHLRDTFMESGRIGSPTTPYWVYVQCAGMWPVVNESAWVRDGALTMWRAVEYTLKKTDAYARFLGYHPSGENGLVDFLDEQL